MTETRAIARSAPFDRNRGLLFAGLIGVAWIVMHIYAVFLLDIAERPWLALAIGAALVWLYVGLFIVAHDAIHETLFGRGNLWNRRVGKLIHFIYAGFDFDRMRVAHLDHHAYSGTVDDPDFNAAHPDRFGPWFLSFLLQYFGWRQIAILTVAAAVYLLLGARVENILLMWAVPSILSAVQLFTFGTYLPHRHASAFADAHNARSNAYPAWLSLLTCFHFGYHHEHHLYPHEPWWRLPVRRREALV